MGVFDSAKDAFEENKNKIPGDKVDEGLAKAGDTVDEKTGGQYSGQVDQAQEFAGDKLGGQDEQRQQ